MPLNQNASILARGTFLHPLSTTLHSRGGSLRKNKPQTPSQACLSEGLLAFLCGAEPSKQNSSSFLLCADASHDRRSY